MHIYRKNPKYEALRLAELERQRLEEEQEQAWKAKRGEVERRIASKTAKNRAKRVKRKAKKESTQ